MARESVHKPRPTGELRSTFPQSPSSSHSGHESVESDKTIQQAQIPQSRQQTTINQSNQEEEEEEADEDPFDTIEKNQSNESLQDEILLLLLESHNQDSIAAASTRKTSVNDQPETEKEVDAKSTQSRVEEQRQQLEPTNKGSQQEQQVRQVRQTFTKHTLLDSQPNRTLLNRTISLPSSPYTSTNLVDEYDQSNKTPIKYSFQQTSSGSSTTTSSSSPQRKRLRFVDKMQRFRRTNEKSKERRESFDSENDKASGISFPSSSGGNSSSSNLFNLSSGLMMGGGKKNKGKARALSSLDGSNSSSMYGIPSSGSTSSLKLPKARNWVNSLMSVGSGSNNSLSKLAVSSNSSKGNQAGYISHVRSNSFNTLQDTPPVSSLVLQTGFENENNPDSIQSPNNLLWRQLEGESSLAMERQGSNVANLSRSATRTTVGTLHMATMSTPNLPSSTSDEWAERLAAPLLVRNLDDEPRGTMTPDVNSVINSETATISARSRRKMTNPWAKLNEQRLQEIHGRKGDASSSSRLINAEEEEQMLDDAVKRDRTEGTMASEEQAVLDMLDQMNETVDTFEKPNVTRTKSMMDQSSIPPVIETKASTATLRPSLKRGNTSSTSALMEGKEAKRRPISVGGSDVGAADRSLSGQKPSVRAFASMFESESGQSEVLLSRARTQFGRKKPLEKDLGSPKIGSVKKAIEERESLDKSSKATYSAPFIESDPTVVAGSGSLLQAMASTLRSKASFPSFRFAATAEDSSSVSPSDASADVKKKETAIDDLDKPSQISIAPPPTSATSSVFLSRQGTRMSRLSTKHDVRSPNQESYISSAGYGSSLWSRRDSIPDSPSSLPTSPGIQSDIDPTSPFGLAFGKRRFGVLAISEDEQNTDYRPIPPMLRRLRTDFTQATSVSSATETDFVKGQMMTTSAMESPMEMNTEEDILSNKEASLSEEEADETMKVDKESLKSLKRERSVAFSTLSKGSDTRLSTRSKASTIPPTPPKKDVHLPLLEENVGRSKSPLRIPLSTNEQGVSPSLLGTPKRAKDLIQFFEQTSAPNSPSLNRTSKPIAKQLSPMKGELPAQMASRFRQALGSSNLTNRLINEELNRSEESAISEKIAGVGRGRRRLQASAGRVGVAVGGGGGSENPFSEPYNPFSTDVSCQEEEEEMSDDDAENRVPQTGFASQPTPAGRRGRRVSSAFLGKLLGGTSPENKKGNTKEVASSDAPGLTESGRAAGSSSNKGSNNSPFRTGVKSIISALSQGVNITGGDAPTSRGGSGGGGGEQGRRPVSWQGAHQSGLPPPSSYRDPNDMRKSFQRRLSDQSEIESAVSTRTIGTTLSFRQKTEKGQNLRVDTASTLALMGKPNVEPFRTGLVYYFNVHVEKPIWQRAQAVLLPSALALSWIPTGGGRVSVVLDLSACREVHSVPGPDHPSSGDDYGAFVAREQGLRRINPLQMIFDDGVERLAVDTARERVVWVASVWDALGIRSGHQPRSRQISTNYSMVGGISDTVTDIAQLHMTTPRPNSPMSPPPPNFNIQLSDKPASRLIASGLAAVPLESSKEDVTQLEITSPDRDRYEAVQTIAAEELPPPPPPKEKVKRKRFIDEPKAANESPEVDSTDERKLSQETLVIGGEKDNNTLPNNASRETFFSSKSARGGSQEEEDDFGPRSPRSEAVLNFGSTADSERDIVPADSASQRPSRSLTGTILSRFTALAGYRSDKADSEVKADEPSEDTELIRTPAQTIRDTFVSGDHPEEAAPSGRILDTVMEETLSQAATANVQRHPQSKGEASRKMSKRSIASPGSALSIQSSGTVNSQEIAKLLQFIEQQNEDRQRRDRQMEEQLRAFTDTVHSLQRGELPSSSGRKHSRRSSSETGHSHLSRRSGTATAAAAATVAADAVGLAAMQEKLDKVLSLVENVTEGQHRLEDINEDGTPRGPQPPTFAGSPNGELARIERTLGSLMNQIQFNTMPQALRADNRSIHVDGSARPLDGRDRAILADRIVHGTHATNRRMSAPPDMTPDGMSENDDGFLTPLTGERAGLPPSDMADLFSLATGAAGNAGMMPSQSESGIIPDSDRIPARSWISADGVPSPPANTERDASMLGSRRGPVERAAYGMMTPTQRDRSGQQYFDPLGPGDSLSNVSIDMEAEIRRRRMRSTVGARDDSGLHQSGGWYTPRQGGQSISPAMFAYAQNSSAGSGLGLSMPKERRPKVSQSIQTPAELERVQGPLNPDIALLLDAIKDNEEARKAQRQQQQDIARYLNELNSWLERDVVDRSKEWRTLALGVTQLHDELNAIKTQNGILPGSAPPGILTNAGGGLMAMPMAQQVQQPAHPDGAGPHIAFMDDSHARTGMPQQFSDANNNATATNTGAGPQGPRGMPSDNLHPSLDPYSQSRPDTMYGGGGYGPMALTSAALEQLGADAPAPINVPRPGSPVKRSGTRTWRAQGGAGALRNDDVWENSGIAEAAKEKKRLKEEKKAERRASRRKSLGNLITAAGISALIAAGYHEFEKYRDRQRQEGKPEEASKEPDAVTGQHVKHDQVPAKEAEKISKAAKSGDETQVRQAILEAASAGAGAAAIGQLVNELGKVQTSSAEVNANDDRTLQGSYDSSTTAKRNAGKLSNDSKYSAGEETLREAVRKIDTQQDGGGGDKALALAVEEILKHLLEKKEDEQRIRQAQAEAEAMREEQRRQDLEERESRLSSLRDQERGELVETIFAKMQAEKERQDAEAAARQREMDPKTAIESLVAAINSQRQADASTRAAADASIKQMAEELVRTTSDANSKLVEAVHTAAREMLRTNVEAHADDLKRLIGRDVSAMFEDVGKIREAKRALESEMAELFHFKSKHLAEIEQMRLANHAPSAVPAPMPMPMPMPGIMPMGMGMGMGGMPGMGGQPIINFSSAPPMPDIPSVPQSQPKASAIPPALPPAGGGNGSALKKKDFMSPFSINFGSR